MSETTAAETATAERRCSRLALSEPMLGTADRVDVWLLLEYLPVWQAKAIEQSDFAPEIRLWLDDTIAALAARGLKARPQLIRQPERDAAETRLIVASAGRAWQFGGSGYDFLQDVDVAALAAGMPRTNRLARTQYFVCTNGRRDMCCSRFGLRTYRALRELVDGDVWQVSHLGGHRFAPNVLTLPDAVLYGRVEETEAEAFVAATGNGGVSFPYLRGRSVYPPEVQAAEGTLALPGLRLLHVNADMVTFAGKQRKHRVRITRGAALSVLASCGDSGTKLIHPYQGEEITE